MHLNFSKAFVAGSLLISASVAGQNKTITGFSLTGSSAQLQLEGRFDQNLSAKNIGEEIKTFSAKPHNIGSPGSKEYAALVEARLKSYGFETRTGTYSVLFPTPVTR